VLPARRAADLDVLEALHSGSGAPAAGGDVLRLCPAVPPVR